MKHLLFTALVFLSTWALAENLGETLLGYVYDDNGITIQVFSGGCTVKEDFLIEKSISNNIYFLTFYRNRVDRCLALNFYGTQLHFSYLELGLGSQPPFKIANKIDASYKGF